MLSKYDKLAERFIKDYDPPFKYIDFNHFKYCLRLFGYDTQWYALEQLVYDKFNDNPQLFLDEFYRVRNEMVLTLQQNKDLEWFSKVVDMSMFAPPEGEETIPCRDIYNCECVNKKFLAIDMRKANFQTLQHISSNIFNNAVNYENYVSQFTDLDYFKDSKHIRQVVLGNINPRRQMTAEKFFMNEIRKTIKGITDEKHLICMSNKYDELIYELSEDSIIDLEYINSLTNTIKEITGFDVKIECFQLKGYEFNNMENGKHKFNFFVKESLVGEKPVLKGVQKAYYKMVHKLYNNIPLDDEDYLVDFEGSAAELIEEYEIVPINEPKYKTIKKKENDR